jgi:hypothetical protein
LTERDPHFLDDPAVAARLDDCGVLPPPQAASDDDDFQSGVDQLDHGLAQAIWPMTKSVVPYGEASARAMFNDGPAAAPSGIRDAFSPAYIAVWVLLMSLGAGAAVLVFHTRVAELILRWHPGGG